MDMGDCNEEHLEAVFRDADVVVLDSQYTLEEAQSKEKWGHSAFCYAIDFAVKMNIKERIASGDACEFCGEPLRNPKTGRRRRFCSDKCRMNYWKGHREELKKSPKAIYTMECPYCHKGKTYSYGAKGKESSNCHVCGRLVLWDFDRMIAYKAKARKYAS